MTNESYRRLSVLRAARTPKVLVDENGHYGEPKYKGAILWTGKRTVLPRSWG